MRVFNFFSINTNFALYKISPSYTETSHLSGIPYDPFESLSRRIIDLIQENASPRDKRFPRFLCHLSDLIRKKNVVNPLDLNAEIVKIFLSAQQIFDERGFGLTLYCSLGKVICCNQTYRNVIGDPNDVPDHLISHLDPSEGTSSSVISIYKETIECRNGSLLEIRITRSSIFCSQKKLVCFLDLTEVMGEVFSEIINAKRFLKNKKILIVDDTPVMQKLTVKALKTAVDSMKCTIIDDGSEAVALFEQGESFDCVLMDLSMPMRGSDATRKIRKIKGCPTVPIIAWTTDPKECCQEEIMAAGMTDYCLKSPRSTNELLILMSRLIKAHECCPAKEEYDQLIELI